MANELRMAWAPKLISIRTSLQKWIGCFLASVCWVRKGSQDSGKWSLEAAKLLGDMHIGRMDWQTRSMGVILGKKKKKKKSMKWRLNVLGAREHSIKKRI